jgi:hypothetical protein
MPHAETREHAHELIELIPSGKIAAAIGLLETMLDPVALSLAKAPHDDEPVSEEEKRDITESLAAYARGEVISHEEVLAEFGLTVEDFERMGQTPLEPEAQPSGL